jgi:hypothetical protein
MMPTRFFLIALLVSPAGQAASFCAQNGSQLQAALSVAATNDQDDEIRVTTGTKTFAVPIGFPHVFGYAIQSSAEEDNDLLISGGWNSNCTSAQAGAQHTVLDGQNQDAHVLEVSRHSAYLVDPRGSYIVRNLTITGAGYGNNAIRGLLATDGNSAEMLLDRVQVRGGRGGIYVYGGRPDLANVLVTEVDGGNDVIDLAPSRTGARIVHSTVHANRMNPILNDHCPLRLSGMSLVANNLAFGNTNYDGVVVRDGCIATNAVQYAPDIVNNHFRSVWMDFLSGQNSTGTTAGVPATEAITVGGYSTFQARFGDLQNSAVALIPAPPYDVFGRIRVQQWAADRGAVESNYCRAPTLPSIQDFAIHEFSTGGGLHPVGSVVGIAGGSFWGATQFAITAGNTAASVFSIDADGTLRLANPGALGAQATYYLTVDVIDACGTSSGTVRVDVIADDVFASSFD